MWYRFSQEWQEKFDTNNYWEKYRERVNLLANKNRTPEEEQRLVDLNRELIDIERRDNEHQEREAPLIAKAKQLIQEGKPEQVPYRYFHEYHRTGNIDGNPYSRYTDDPDGLNWLKPESFDIPIKTFERNGKNYEIKAEQEELKYCKRDDNDEFVRDSNGELVYLTLDEMKAKGYPPFGYTLALFHDNKIIGFAGDEFGASGVYLQKPYQGQGLGSLLLHEYLKISGRLQKGKKIGQMTSWGSNMIKSLHKLIVEEALKEGKHVPEYVLKNHGFNVK